MAVTKILVILYPCIKAVPYQGTLNLKNILVINTTHHHMVDACS